MKQTRFLLLAFLFSFLTVSPLWAKSDLSTPRGTVQTLLNTIKAIEGGDNLSANQAQSNQKHSSEAIALLDVHLVSEKTLGKYWSKRSKEEKEKFVTLLADLFKHVAFPNSAKFFSELKMEFGETQNEKEVATVPLKVIHKDEGEVHIDFVLTEQASNWRVVDVVLDGVSMRNNLRTQFYKIIQKEDYPELVRRMLKKLKEARG